MSHSTPQRRGGPRTRPNRQQKAAKLVADGHAIAKFFNAAGGRPYPMFLTLVPTIKVQMTGFTSNWVTSSLSVPVYNAIGFGLNSFGGYTNYTALFDQYRIDQLEVWLEMDNPYTVATNSSEVATCVDLDDSTTPSTIASVADHPGALVGSGQAGRYFRWKPHVAVAAYSGSFTSYQNEVADWMDSASPGVLHFGFKAALGPVGVAVQSYNLTYRAIISFRSPGIA